jgi:hypothetical protein
MKPRFGFASRVQPQSVTLPSTFCPEIGFALTMLKTTPAASRNHPGETPEQAIRRQHDRVFWWFIAGCLVVSAVILLAILFRSRLP